MNKNLEDGEAIVSPWISKAIETAQKKVEARNYDIRKQVVEFDDVMNDQRKVIYEQRSDIMDAEDVNDIVVDMRAETAVSLVTAHCPPGTYPEQWDVEALKESIDAVFGLQPPVDAWLEEEAVEQELIVERLQKLADETMEAKLADVEPERWNQVEKNILLQTLDHFWKEHLSTLDSLRAEEADRRIQAGSLPAVRAAAHLHPRGSHARPDACSGTVRDASAAGAAGLHYAAYRSAIGRRRYCGRRPEHGIASFEPRHFIPEHPDPGASGRRER